MDSLKKCIMLTTGWFLVVFLCACASHKVAMSTSQTGATNNPLILLDDAGSTVQSKEDFDENEFRFEVYTRVENTRRVM